MHKEKKVKAPEPEPADAAREAIAGYKAARKALERARHLSEKYERELDAERSRCAREAAERIAAIHDPNVTVTLIWDESAERAQQVLLQARAVHRACHEQLHVAGAKVITAQEQFLIARTAAAAQAVQQWKQRYIPMILEAAAEQANIEATFQIKTLTELGALPPAPGPVSVQPNVWNETAVELETISREQKRDELLRGKFRIVAAFEWAGRDWTMGTVVDSDCFADSRVLERLLSTGRIVRIPDDGFGAIKPPRKPGAIDAGPEQHGILREPLTQVMQ